MRERFRLLHLPGGVVLLNYATGALYRPNRTAQHVLSAVLRGESLESAVRSLADAFQIPASIASHDVADLMGQLDTACPSSGNNPISFQSYADSHCMRWQGRPILRTDARGTRVTLERDSSAFGVESSLLWAAPHLLALQGQPVLHASAVEVAGGVLAFSGPSGSGKTTLARLLARRGGRLVSEDLVLITTAGGRPAVLSEGEPMVHRWISEAHVVAEQWRTIDSSPLRGAENAPTLPLLKVLFLDSRWRSGTQFMLSPLDPASLLGLLFENGFLEIGCPEVWDDYADSAVRIAGGTIGARLTVPDGLGALGVAVRDYSSIVMS